MVIPKTKSYERGAFDLWGPAYVQTTNGKVFMLVAIDQASVECKAWYLSNKSKEATIECLKGFNTRVETQLRMHVKCI